MAGRDLENFLDEGQRRVWSGLESPAAIQAFLDEIPYSAEDANRCPRRVLQDRQAHCLDGALFAAAALRKLGFPPLVLDLLPEPGRDDDHVLALYKVHGCWGAVAKSNFVGLRAREPVYRGLRELAMSYFEVFFNVQGEKTLRAYSRPVRLAAFDRWNWVGDDAGADAIEKHLKGLRHIPLLAREQALALSPVDPLSYRAGTLATDPAGLYKPEQR